MARILLPKHKTGGEMWYEIDMFYKSPLLHLQEQQSSVFRPFDMS